MTKAQINIDYATLNPNNPVLGIKGQNGGKRGGFQPAIPACWTSPSGVSKSQAGRAPVIVAGDGNVASCMAASCSSRCGFPSFLLVYRGHRTAENAACRRESSKTEETVICQEPRRVRLSLSPASERLRVSSWAGSAPLPVACGSSQLLGSCAVRLGSRGATVPGRPLSRNNTSQEQEGRRAVRVRTKPSAAFASVAAGSPSPPGFDSYTECYRGEMSIFFKFSKSP